MILFICSLFPRLSIPHIEINSWGIYIIERLRIRLVHMYWLRYNQFSFFRTCDCYKKDSTKKMVLARPSYPFNPAFREGRLETRYMSMSMSLKSHKTEHSHFDLVHNRYQSRSFNPTPTCRGGARYNTQVMKILDIQPDDTSMNYM